MVFEAVKKMLAIQLDIEEETITMDTKIVDDLSADSLDIVEMLMAVEDEYGIEIPDEDAANLVTVGDIVDYIQDRQG